MNFSHLYSSALDQELGTDDSTRLFTTQKRQDAIKWGELQFVDLTECAIKQSTVVSSHGVAEYNLLSSATGGIGTDFLRIAKQGIEYHHITSGGSTTFIAGDLIPRREIPWLNQYEPGWRASTAGTPRAFYERMDGGQRLIGLVPPPEIANSSEVGKLVIPYVAKPSESTASTYVPFTFGSTVRLDLEPYHKAIVHFGASELEKLRLNTEGSQAQLQIAMGYVQRFLGMLRPHGLQTVRLARNYFQEARGKRRGDDVLQVPYPWRQ